ncbi:MAG: sulfotransferase [Deltaproteobacteria bacterium]|nr:sulfotransferase [Deltaproteobacteria bacterium]
MSKEKLKYLYIAGYGRSGSTLLSFLLNSHKQMVSIGEAFGFGKRAYADNNFPCSCGEPFLRCPFYLKLEQLVNDFGSPFNLKNWRTTYDFGRYGWSNMLLSGHLGNSSLDHARDIFVRFLPGIQKKTGLVSKEKLNIARAVLAISGKQVFVDASKVPVNIKYLQMSDQLDLHVIHLVRDVRGVVNSNLKNNKDIDVSLLARAWKRANMRSDWARKYVPRDRWFRLTYDEVCADAQAVVNRVADFVGIEQINIPENYYEVEHHIQGNYMRLKHTGTVVRDDAWKKRFTEHDLDAIAQVAGKANCYFGHDWP